MTKNILYDSFNTVKLYTNEYHNERSLKICKFCGQLYFYEFIEIIDFRDGNDSEYHTYIPIKSIKDADKLNKLSNMELSVFLSIRMNFPPYDSNPYWFNRESFE